MDTQKFYKEFERQVGLIGLKTLLEGFSLYLDKQVCDYRKQAEQEKTKRSQEMWLFEADRLDRLGIKIDDFLTTQCSPKEI